MKKILKFLLLPVFVLSPTITVVACGSDAKQISDQDILNSAAGRMQNHTFNMKQDLDLKSIPVDKSAYNALSSTARSKITSYYSDLVKPGLNWDYPQVTVEVRTDDKSSSFLTKYGLAVESRINLTVDLKYKTLKASKNIVIKINNDETNDWEKINAIGQYLENYLKANENLTFPFKTLFKDNLMSNDVSANFVYGQIQASLRNSLFIPTKENPIPVIDVAGVDMTIEKPSNVSNIYNLEGIKAANKVVAGTLQNLTLIINYKTGYCYQLKDKTFKIIQSFSDTNNQIATILNQGEQGLQFKKVDLVDQKLPSENQTLEKYDSGNTFRKKVAEKIFTFISIVFPEEKMKGTDTWDASRIIIENAASSPYVKLDENHGFFIVNIKFSFNVDANSKIETSVGALKLNLNNLE